MTSHATIPTRSLDWILNASRRDRDRRFGCRLLDVRPPGVSGENHLPGSARLPVEGASPRPEELSSHLLPSRDRVFVVLDPDPDRRARVTTHLRDRGFTVAMADAWVPAEALRPGSAAGALWQPDPLLEKYLALLPPPEAGVVLDLGAGSGRDAVFLAMHGYDCLLIDRLEDALELATSRARHHGVDIRTHVGDLRDATSIPAGPYSMMLSIRFLQRSLLATASDLLIPQGALVLRAFADPPPRADDPRVSPESGSRRPHRPQFRIGLEELSSLLPATSWDFIHEPRIAPWRDELWLEAIGRVSGPA
jgi:SAM-dependent methyltransferase